MSPKKYVEGKHCPNPSDVAEPHSREVLDTCGDINACIPDGFARKGVQTECDRNWRTKSKIYAEGRRHANCMQKENVDRCAKWQSHGYTGTEKIPRHPMEPVCKISSNILWNTVEPTGTKARNKGTVNRGHKPGKNVERRCRSELLVKDRMVRLTWNPWQLGCIEGMQMLEVVYHESQSPTRLDRGNNATGTIRYGRRQSPPIGMHGIGASSHRYRNAAQNTRPNWQEEHIQNDWHEEHVQIGMRDTSKLARKILVQIGTRNTSKLARGIRPNWHAKNSSKLARGSRSNWHAININAKLARSKRINSEKGNVDTAHEMLKPSPEIGGDCAPRGTCSGDTKGELGTLVQTKYTIKEITARDHNSTRSTNGCTGKVLGRETGQLGRGRHLGTDIVWEACFLGGV
ncbi:hypothetical protein B0H13DRAFT_1908493 [Mycena leptocephala]|nr:hypothetical protein B0H13DRAFT_1908493 [Mycena leptocephala]